MSRVLRVLFATVQPALGVVALLCSGTTLTLVTGKLGDDGPGWPVLVVILIGIVLCIVWGLARRRRAWLITLAAVAAALAVGMILLTLLAWRPAWHDPRTGLWGGVWAGAVASVLWIMITAAAGWELRVLGPDAEGRPPRWATASAVAAPLVVITGVAIVITVAAPAWMIRVNSMISSGAPPATAQASRLTGTVRWTLDSYASAAAAVTASGLAVPVGADHDQNAGVIMIDPVTGAINWRYQLRGFDAPPTVAVTDHGQAVVVRFDEREHPADASDRSFTLDARTGRITAFWPDDLVAYDPPVRFDHVAQDTNSVTAFSTRGRKLWTYKPQRCADPRGAASTPEVILVPARRCDSGDRLSYQLHGFAARSGDQLWTQPWDGESAPDPVAIGDGFQVERAGSTLRRRDLRTGKITWRARLACSRAGAFSATQRSVVVDSCPGESGHETVAAYGLGTGKQLWRSALSGRTIASLATVDDHRVLAVTRRSSGSAGCAAEVLDGKASRTVQSFREDARGTDPAAPYRQGTVQCQDSAVYRVGGSMVLQLKLAQPSGGNIEAEKYRFIGLS